MNLRLENIKTFLLLNIKITEDPKTKDGFGSLFKYISNDNKENEKIPMTVPVISKELDQQRTIAFVVPAKFGDQIPKPNNPNVQVRKFKEGIF